jgi:hypothetical protein
LISADVGLFLHRVDLVNMIAHIVSRYDLLAAKISSWHSDAAGEESDAFLK